MKCILVGLVLGMTLAAGRDAMAAEDPLPQKLTPQERKELEAKWKELNIAAVKHYRAGKLAKATPEGNAPYPRAVEPPTKGRVIAEPQVGGLHHRYRRAG
jgi:hypothetical protein